MRLLRLASFDILDDNAVPMHFYDANRCVLGYIVSVGNHIDFSVAEICGSAGPKVRMGCPFHAYKALLFFDIGYHRTER